MPKDSSKVGLFKFEEKFHVTGKGLFIVGQIIDGKIMPGNSVYLNNEQLSFKILGVEVGHNSAKNFIALNIDLESIFPESDFDKLIGQTLTICN